MTTRDLPVNPVRRAADHHDVMAKLGKPKPEPKAKGKRKQTKSERKMLEKLLWNTASLYIRKRDGVCVTCGATEGLTMSHWIKAGKQRVRYDDRNVNCQCSTCNNTHNRWAYFYDRYMLKRYGEKIMLELTELAMGNSWKWTVLDLRRMLTEYQQKLAAIS